MSSRCKAGRYPSPTPRSGRFLLAVLILLAIIVPALHTAIAGERKPKEEITFGWTIRPFIQIRPLIFEALVQNVHGKTEPLLATGWRWIHERTLELRLRENVFFHDGSPFNADSVLQNFYLYKAYEPLPGRFKAFPPKTMIQKIESYKIQITYPQRPLWPFLRLSFFFQASPTYLHDNANRNLRSWPEIGRPGPYGSGPFVLKKGFATPQHSSDRTVLEKNQNYWDPRYPGVGRLIFVPTPRSNEETVKAISQGVLDLTASRFSLTDIDISRPNVEIDKIIGPALVAIFNQRKSRSLWREKRLRLALNLLINKEEIIQQLLGGNGTILGGLLPSTLLGHNPNLRPYRFNPQRGVRILAELREAEYIPRKLEIKVIIPFFSRIAEILRSQLGPFGIIVTYDALQPLRFFQKINVIRESKEEIANQQWDILILPIYPMFGTFGLYSTLFSSSGIYRWVLEDAHFNALFWKAGFEWDSSKRAILLRDIEEYLYKNICCLFLYEIPAILLRHRRIQPIDPNSDALTFLKQVKLREKD